MPRLTLVWISRPDRPFKIISLPKAAIYLIAGGLASLFALSCALLCASWISAEQRLRIVEENSRLKKSHVEQTQSLQERNKLIAEKNTSIDTLNEQLSTLTQQLITIRDNETKIRKFLGLENKGVDPKHPNQGGSGIIDGRSSIDRADDVRRAAAGPPVDHLIAPLCTSLQASLLDLLEHIEKKHHEATRLPTILPVSGSGIWLSSGFGWRSNPHTGTSSEYHTGIDVTGPYKSPIIAPADGEVLETGEDRSFGKFVRLRHHKGVITLFAHLHTVEVSQGASVKRRQVIGYMGNTGRSTGTHLHYSVIKDGKHVNPFDYIWDTVVPTLGESAHTDEVL